MTLLIVGFFVILVKLKKYKINIAYLKKQMILFIKFL